MDLDLIIPATIGAGLGIWRAWKEYGPEFKKLSHGAQEQTAPPVAPASAPRSAESSAVNSAWATGSALRWMQLYGAKLSSLEGFAVLGKVKIFRSSAQDYLSASLGEFQAKGRASRGLAVIAELFRRVDCLPDFEPEQKKNRQEESAPVSDFPEDMPEDSPQEINEDIPSGWDHEFYKSQSRAAFASGLDLSEPQTLLEVVANAFKGKKYFLSKKDFARETGYKKELDRFAYFWAKEGGLSVIAWAENIAESYNYTGLIPKADGGGWDVQEVRNSIIELFASCSKPADIFSWTEQANRERLEQFNSTL